MITKSTALPAVESELQRQVAGLSGSMRAVCGYATEGGRRIRAALLLDVAGQSDDRAVRAATSLEMLHAATLLQDDIFDSGVIRRGRIAAYVRFGKAQTILASDWLLIRALELAAEVDPRFFRCLAHAGTTMAQAEARELEPAAFESIEEAERYGCAIARGKTAVLFGTAMYGAAVLRGVSPAECHCWQALGAEMGWTYQLVDDCVDLYVGEAAAGKSVGHDLIAGCFTMPMLLAAFWMRKRGIRVSIEALQRGPMETRELHQVMMAVCSVEVKRQMQQMVQQRLTAHRREAQKHGVAAEAVEIWVADLLARTALCFPNDETGFPNEEPGFPNEETAQPSDQALAGVLGPADEERQRCA